MPVRTGVLVNVGGDLRVEGRAPGDGGWVVDLEHPITGRASAPCASRAGAIASTWRTSAGLGCDRARHVTTSSIPRPGASACSGLAGTTVLAARAWWAEVLAKAAFVDGPAGGPAAARAARRDGIPDRRRRASWTTSGPPRRSRPERQDDGAKRMEHLAWYVSRSTGIVTWGLLVASMLWGFLYATRLLGRRARPWWMLGVHRFLGALAVAFVVVHVLALIADSYTSFGLVDILVPFASAWRPIPVALGIVGFYVLVAVELTSLAQRYLPRTVWRQIHLASYGLFAFATLHALSAGTDVGDVLSVAWPSASASSSRCSARWPGWPAPEPGGRPRPRSRSGARGPGRPRSRLGFRSAPGSSGPTGGPASAPRGDRYPSPGEPEPPAPDHGPSRRDVGGGRGGRAWRRRDRVRWRRRWRRPRRRSFAPRRQRRRSPCAPDDRRRSGDDGAPHRPAVRGRGAHRHLCRPDPTDVGRSPATRARPTARSR